MVVEDGGCITYLGCSIVVGDTVNTDVNLTLLLIPSDLIIRDVKDLKVDRVVFCLLL